MTPASRHRHSFWLLPCLLAAAATAQSASDDARQPSRLTAYLYGKEQIAALYEAGRHWDGKLGLQQRCKGAYNIQPLGLFVLRAIDFPPQKAHPVAGSWQHRFIFERCGRRMTYNAVFVARDGDRPELLPHFPGDSNASLAQITAALKSIAPAAARQLSRPGRRCSEAELVDTRLVHPPRPAEGTQPPAILWEEAWTFRCGGHDAVLHVVFAPDGQGGITAGLKAAK